MTPSLSIRAASSKDARACAEITELAYGTLSLYRRSYSNLSQCLPKLIDARVQRYEKVFAGTSADRFVLVHHDDDDRDIATVRWTIVEGVEEEEDEDATTQRRLRDVQRVVGDDVPIDAALLGAMWRANARRHRSAIRDGSLALPHMYMHSMATLPAYTGLGAASRALRYVMNEADAKRLPVYLDATHVAAPLYAKFGFRRYAVDRIDDGSSDGEAIVVEAMIRPANAPGSAGGVVGA